MGIPAYFSHIVKQFPQVIQKFVINNLKVKNFFLDCNSIIYDVYRNIENNNN